MNKIEILARFEKRLYYSSNKKGIDIFKFAVSVPRADKNTYDELTCTAYDTYARNLKRVLKTGDWIAIVGKIYAPSRKGEMEIVVDTYDMVSDLIRRDEV